MKKSDNNIIRRTKRRVAMLVAFIFALSAIAVPGSVKEVKAADSYTVTKISGEIVSGNEIFRKFSELSVSDGKATTDIPVSSNKTVKITHITISYDNQTEDASVENNKFSGTKLSGEVDTINLNSTGPNFVLENIKVKKVTETHINYKYAGGEIVAEPASISVKSSEATTSKIREELNSIVVKIPVEKYDGTTKVGSETMVVSSNYISWNGTTPATNKTESWVGTISKEVKSITGIICDLGTSKTVTVPVTVYEDSANAKVTWNVSGTVSLDDDDGNVINDKITSIKYVIKYDSGQSDTIKSNGLSLKDSSSFTLKGEKSLPWSSYYYLEVVECTLNSGIIADGEAASNHGLITYDISKGIWTADITETGFELDIEYPLLPGLYATSCLTSDGFVSQSTVGYSDDHTSLNGGQITTSSLKDVGLVRSILNYAYKKNIYLQEKLNEIIEESSDDVALSLIFYAKELSSSDVDNKSALQDKARDFGSDSKSAELKEYFDLSLYVTANDELLDVYQDDEGMNHSIAITEAGSNVSFTYTIPKEAKLSSSSSSTRSRYFNIVRYHNGAKDAGISEYKKNEDKLYPKTSQFSEFALAYYDKTSSSSSSSSSYNGSSTYRGSSGSGSSPVSDTIDKSGAPKTGDDFDARKWVFILVIGVVVALCSLILYQDTKDWREDRKQ